jgi:hypothetical protein
MTRAEQKALWAQVAPRIIATLAAKNAVKAHIRAQGLRLNDYSNRDLTLLAERWLAERPHLLAEARLRLQNEKEKQ